MNLGTKLHRHRGLALLGELGLAVLLCWPGTGQAVENIRNVTWNHSREIAWDPQVSVASVTFDADLTPLEAAYAITSFSLGVVHAAGSPEILYRCSVGPLPRGSAGATARFHIELSMSCNPTYKTVSAAVVSATAQGINPSIGSAPMRLYGEPRNVLISSQETMGLAILDQDGRMSQQSLPRETFSCLNGPVEPNHGTIGVYFDAAGTQCSGTIPAGESGKVYVVAHLDGPTAAGIAGAEFSFDGMPNAWEAYSVPDPQILAIGDPFTDGVAMGFVCRTNQEGPVVLYTVVVFAHEDVADVMFEIQQRKPALSMPCPLLLACDEPVFTKYCVESVPCFVNARAPSPCDVPLAVEASSWSGVKALYR